MLYLQSIIFIPILNFYYSISFNNIIHNEQAKLHYNNHVPKSAVKLN
jgi:hypothetical protein